MKTSRKRPRKFSTDLLFQVEQWIALLVGIVCFAVFLWAALDGRKAFSVGHLPPFSTTMLVSNGWLLTIATGLIGVTLTRFAFYEHCEPQPDAKSQSRRVRMASGGSTRNSSDLILIAANKRRR